jgi:hypothetical protein
LEKLSVELSWVMQFYSHLEIKAKSPRGSVHITEAAEAIVFQEGELWSVSTPFDEWARAGLTDERLAG